MTQDSLMHYGVLGMKWGVRKDKQSGGSSSNSKADRKAARKEKKAVRKEVKKDFKKLDKAKNFYFISKKQTKSQVRDEMQKKAAKSDAYDDEYNRQGKIRKVKKTVVTAVSVAKVLDTALNNSRAQNAVNKKIVETGASVLGKIYSQIKSKKTNLLTDGKKIAVAKDVINMVQDADGVFRKKGR